MVFTTYIIWKFAQLMQMSHGDLATSPVSSVGLSWHMGLVDNIMYLTVLSSKWGHLALSLSIVFLCLVSYIATRLRATSGELCKLWQGKEIFLFSKTLPPLEPSQTSFLWVPGDLSLGVKWPEHEADHSLRLKMHGALSPLPQMPSWCAKVGLYLYLCFVSSLCIL